MLPGRYALKPSYAKKLAILSSEVFLAFRNELNVIIAAFNQSISIALIIRSFWLLSESRKVIFLIATNRVNLLTKLLTCN